MTRKMCRTRQRGDRRRPHPARDEAGQGGLIAMVLVLLVLGTLGAVAFATLGSGGSGGGDGGLNAGPFTGVANDASAKSTLSQAQSAVQAAALQGYGSVSAASLQASATGVTFTSGASTAPGTVSVTTTASSATLAAFSTSGTCWLVWLGPGGPLYGAQTGLKSCTAPSLPGPPQEGPVSSGAIGWSSGSFPSA